MSAGGCALRPSALVPEHSPMRSLRRRRDLERVDGARDLLDYRLVLDGAHVIVEGLGDVLNRGGEWLHRAVFVVEAKPLDRDLSLLRLLIF